MRLLGGPFCFLIGYMMHICICVYNVYIWYTNIYIYIYITVLLYFVIRMICSPTVCKYIRQVAKSICPLKMKRSLETSAQLWNADECVGPPTKDFPMLAISTQKGIRKGTDIGNFGIPTTFVAYQGLQVLTKPPRFIVAIWSIWIIYHQSIKNIQKPWLLCPSNSCSPSYHCCIVFRGDLKMIQASLEDIQQAIQPHS